MEKCTIILTDSISENSRQAIMSIKPDYISLIDISDSLKRECKIGKPLSHVVSNALLNADVIYGGNLPVNFLKRAPKLKWVQVTSAGVDRYISTELTNSQVMLTSVSGIHAVPIGEFVLTFMLMLAKRIPYSYEMKLGKEWRQYTATTLLDKTIGIIGLGHIGKEVARLSKAFGMNVIATRRTVKLPGKTKNVDRLLPANSLPQLLNQSDFVVITLPLTDETRNMFSDKQFRMMKTSAYIISIGRGQIIDEAALIHALQNKHIAGAGLDVFAIEPLPPTSPLWEMPNVIITPHISGGMDDYERESTRVFCKNLNHFLAGKRLLNVVNKKVGY